METPEKCPRCGSEYIVKGGKRYLKIKRLLQQRYICETCGRRFAVKLASPNSPDFKYKSKKVPSQDWSAYTQAQNAEKLMVMSLVNELTGLFEFTSSRTVGRKNEDIAGILFCLVLKTYTGLSSRRLISDLELAREKGFISKVCHFTTLMNYFDDERITPLLYELIRLAAIPLKQREVDFAIDSSGFSTSKFGRWFDHKWDQEKERRIYLKAHLVSGVKSNIVSSVEITPSSRGDSPQFIPLLKKTSIDFKVKEISADKAYSSKKNLQAAVDLGAMPYIPFRRGTKDTWNVGHIWNKMYWFFRNKPQEFMEHYHKRSNAETVFHMIKQKFGSSLMTRNHTANVNEALLKVLCHNLCVLIQEFHENQVNLDLSTQAPKQEILLKKA